MDIFIQISYSQIAKSTIKRGLNISTYYSIKIFLFLSVTKDLPILMS
ncbi:hypothetical protein HMPREF3191_01623 [Veillonellaceae bacterium DNF00626]|nr:hypothetical protein HMPREF3191_01623 [Veillonellaceae bacterium DNF00626]